MAKNNTFDFKREAILIGKAVGKLQDRIQKYLVAVVRDWYNSGDVRPVPQRVNWLVEALGGTGVRSNAVKAWVEAHLGLVWSMEEKCFVFGNKKKISEDEAKNACATKWWEFKPEPEYKPLILSAELEKIIKKAEKRIKNAKPEDQVSSKQIGVLYEALQKIEELEKEA